MFRREVLSASSVLIFDSEFTLEEVAYISNDSAAFQKMLAQETEITIEILEQYGVGYSVRVEFSISTFYDSVGSNHIFSLINGYSKISPKDHVRDSLMKLLVYWEGRK